MEVTGSIFLPGTFSKKGIVLGFNVDTLKFLLYGQTNEALRRSVRCPKSLRT